jgi:hypothetical protein
MSVINKMLRDLDARQAAATGFSRETGTRVMQGTSGVPGQRPAKSLVRALRWLVALLVLVAASATAWYLHQAGSFSGNRPQPVAAVVATPSPAPEPAVSVPILTATTSVQVDGAPPTPSTPVSSVTAQAAAAPPATRIQAAPAAPSQPQAGTRRIEPVKAPAPVLSQRMPSDRAAAVPTPAVVASAPARTSITPEPQFQRQTAAQETLAHAQALWAAGSRPAALDLMREAVAAAERAHNAGTLAAGSPVLPSLVRELARMELAEGRVSRVLDMLVRLEPALADQADLWAVRGNAAQRLARHQESVQAYLRALELRPDEPRWMLGAAVSLAALGRPEAAAEQAEKARAAGSVSPEILTYLRQAGVPLK